MKKAKIVILAGQSNAVGVGRVEYLPCHFDEDKVAEYKRGYDDVKINFYSHDVISNGFVGTGTQSSLAGFFAVGPELSMAEYFSNNYPDENIFIVKCAVGSTNLYDEWCSPSTKPIYSYEETKDCSIYSKRITGWCYNNLVALLWESIRILEGDGYAPEIVGFCWMQGESDSGDEEKVSKYIGGYKNLLLDLKSEFDGYFSKNCTFVDAGISEIWTDYKRINEMKRKFAEDEPNCIFIDTIKEGLTTKNEPHGKPDIYHYDIDSVIKLGHLFAQNVNVKGE